MTMSQNTRVVVAKNQVSSEFPDNEIVVMDVNEGAYYVLNEVGARVWTMIQTPKQVGELVAALTEEYDVPADLCAQEVLELLADLASRKLIEVQDEVS